jgi:small subunit ribosomal protein S6
MRHYETLIVVKPTLTESEIQGQIDSIQETIKELGGDIRAVQNIGLRKLAYEIDKNVRGHYTVIYHYSPTSIISEVERKLRYNEDVLRFLTIKYETKKEISKFNEFVKRVAGSEKPAEKTQTQEEKSTEA